MATGRCVRSTQAKALQLHARRTTAIGGYTFGSGTPTWTSARGSGKYSNVTVDGNDFHGNVTPMSHHFAGGELRGGQHREWAALIAAPGRLFFSSLVRYSPGTAKRYCAMLQ